MTYHVDLNQRFLQSGRETKERILEAAADAFAERGFRASTMRDIANAAHVNEVTIYRYFPRKQELCWRAVDWKLRNIDAAKALVQALACVNEPGDLLQTLSTALHEIMQREPSLARLLYFTGLELQHERQHIFKAHVKPVLVALSVRLRSWIHDGKVRAIDSETTAIAILGVLLSRLHLRELFGPVTSEEKSVTDLAAEYSKFCLSGLATSNLKPN